MKEVNFQKIEKKWQDKWEKTKIFQTKKNNKKKYYVLEQFPYPSGSGLHVGHSFVYTIGDIYARFKRMKGFNVLHPMGYDSLGLPAENAAIKQKVNPKKYTENSIKYFSKQQKALGLSYDWERQFATHEPSYYKWDQWIFLKMFEKGLAYKKQGGVNWCPSCKTVLANEQAQGGVCERCGSKLEFKNLSQWYLKITDYANELADFNSIKEWPDLIKKLQKNWIGKSYGTEIDFEINREKWPIFTTRPDTIYGVTFMVISAQHPKLFELVTKDKKKEVENFVKKLSSVSEEEIDQLEKQGVFTGSYAINPINNEKIPVYAGNFVLADYGSGMVMAVPAHDQRDFEFAKKYKIKIKEVIYGGNIKKEAYIGEGKLINSNEFNGIENKDAKIKITEYLEKNKLGRKKVNFRLRDWLISRQRYWGTPIPIIYCDKCGIVPVSEKNLPVKLPDNVKFGKGNPLETAKDWIKVKCPKCNGIGKRETDTMDTFVNSSWYHLRFCDSYNEKRIFDSEKTNYWVPIDMYIGGKEHACMHDIYIRFYHKFLRDLKLINSDEPAKKLFVQGIVHGEDGNKMSKSLGNVVDPMDIIKKYGADSLRMFLVSVANPESNFNWSDRGVENINKFLKKIFNYFQEIKIGKSSKKFQSKLNSKILQITKDIEEIKYNLAIIKIRELFDSFENEISKKDLEKFLKLLSPFCPHISEELWEKINGKGFISLENWPKADESKIDKELEKMEEQLNKTISDINNIINLLRNKKEMKNIYIYVIPKEKEFYKKNKELIKNKTLLNPKVFAVNDKEIYDPEGKAKKTKPGKPGIFLK